MSAYYLVEPEVAGGWGRNTVFTRTPGQPTVVHKLHYVFDDWLGDELLESDACYIVTERLAGQIGSAGLTGVSFDEVEISRSQEFEDWNPSGRDLPRFLWMKVIGQPGKDDFWMAPKLVLAVSDRALSLLKRSVTARMDVSGPFSE